MEANFHQLRIFLSVDRVGSFSRAASELSISQPAVSIQVQELERGLGTPLIRRSRRGLHLTDTGEVVYDYARRIFGLAEEMYQAVADVQGLRRGKLTVGASSTPGEYILPEVIGRFQQRYPGVAVSLQVSNTRSVVESIVRRELDVGLVGAPVSQAELVTSRYMDDEICIIASPSHPLAQRSRLTLEDLRGQQFILREEGSATRSTAEDYFRQLGIEIKVVMELGSNEAVKRAVAAGLGLGAISKYGVGPEVVAKMLRILPVQRWLCKRPLTIVYRRDRHLATAQRAFLEFMHGEKHPRLPGSQVAKG